MAISSPLQSKVPTGSTKTIRKLQTILLNRTKVKREVFQRQTILQNRREENERRKQREDALEAPNLVRTVRGPSQLIVGSAKGFFDRLVGFLGYLTAGWIINNLPTWISMGKEFIARTQQMGKILGGFITNSTDIFKDFTRLLGATLTNLMTFDFLDTSGRVSTAFDELKLSVDNWGTGFEDAIKLLTTPLTEGIASGENARPTGTQNTNEGAYKQSAPYSGSGGTGGGGRWKPMLDLISSGEGGYASMYPSESYPEMLNMTIAELVQFQKQKFGDGRRSAAVGRYQFISPDYAAKLAGLPITAKFTPENQDKMAVAYLEKKRPGKQWLDGKISTREYIEDLAREWGAFRSYSGYVLPGNSGKIRPEKIEAALNKVKKGSDAPSSTQAPQQSTPTRIEQVPPRKINPIVGDRLGAGRNHGGTDLAVDNGTPLRAVSDGVIVDSDYEKGWGNFLVMKDNLGIYHLYGHMQSGYKRSGPVKKGEVIGKVGTTGRTTGPHLHWEAGTGWNGGTITGKFDPLNKYSKFAPFNTSYSESSPLSSQSPTPTPAQITPTGTPQNPQITQSLAQERTGPTIIVSETPPPQQMMYSGGGGSSGGESSQISEFALLNNFMRNKLLLDLAYL